MHLVYYLMRPKRDKQLYYIAAYYKFTHLYLKPEHAYKNKPHTDKNVLQLQIHIVLLFFL